MDHLIRQHKDFQAIASRVAVKHPTVIHLLNGLFTEHQDEQRETLMTWHCRMKSMRRRSGQQVLLQDRRHDKMKRHALAAWDAFRSQVAVEATQSALASQLNRRFFLRGLCCSIWEHWLVVVASSKRKRHGYNISGKANWQRLLRPLWLSWRRRVASATTAASAARKLEEAWSEDVLRSALRGWSQRCRWEATVRKAAFRLMALQIPRYVSDAFSHWYSVARALIVLETRHRLQADDMRRRQRSMLCASVAAAWHQEAVRARCEAQRTRAVKVMKSWQLYAKEQALLKRYLNQCAAASFSGGGSALTCNGDASVQPADFEHLYEEMAALRWD
jgi:hypothetical protein